MFIKHLLCDMSCVLGVHELFHINSEHYMKYVCYLYFADE